MDRVDKCLSARRLPSWRVLLLPVALIALIASGAVILRTNAQRSNDEYWKRVLDKIVSPATAKAIGRDEIMRRNYVTVVDFAADTSSWLAERYQSSQLQEASNALSFYAKEFTATHIDRSPRAQTSRALIPRQLFGGGNGATDDKKGPAGLLGGLGDMISGGLAGIGQSLLGDVAGAGMFLGIGIGEGAATGLNMTTADKAKAIGAKVAAASGMNNSGLNPTIENLGSGLAGTLLGSLDLGSLTGGGTIGLAVTGLASGIGNGAVSGLKLNAIPPPPPNPNATGIADIANMFGFGLTSTVTSNLDLNTLTNGAMSGQLMAQLPPAALSLAQGLGNGAVSGLKINANVAPPTGTAVPDLAGAFGFGLTQSITSNIDVNSLGNGAMALQLMQQLPPIALGLAQGIGSGAVSGLKLNTNVAPATGTSVPEIANAFGFGLTQSVTSNVDFAQVAGGGQFNAVIMQNLPAAASGFGKGLGEGIPIGLGIQPDPGMLAMKTMADGSLDVAGVAENFAMGLTSRLLANGTVTKLTAQMGSGGSAGTGGAATNLLMGMDIGKTAGGFARGLLQGAGDGITAMGGLQALIDGKSVTPPGPIAETPVEFDDSLGGAAVGFGQGFGTQGVLVAKSVIGQLNPVSQVKQRAESIDGLVPLHSRDIEIRQAATPEVVLADSNTNATALFNISSILDAESISGILQKGIEVLSCEGVGGLAGVALGLSKSGMLPTTGLSNNTLSQFKDLLPKGIIHFTSEGNNYRIDMQNALDNLPNNLLGAANAIEVNGNKGVAFAAFLVIHILFGITVFLNVVPAALGLESARNILLRIRKPHVMPWIPKWVNIMWLFIIAPSILIVLIFGAVAVGNSAHFRTAHGVLGLLTVIDGLAAVALHFVVKTRAEPSRPLGDMADSPEAPAMIGKIRTYNNQLFLLLVVLTSLSGWGDMSKIALCVTQVVPFELVLSLGFGLASVFTVGQAVSGLDLFLDLREARLRKKGSGELGGTESGLKEKSNSDSESSLKNKLKEKIRLVR